MILKHRWKTVIVLQAVLVSFSLLAAWFLRFEFSLPRFEILLSALPLLLLMRLAALARFNLLHAYWRFTSVSDLGDIIQAVVTGSVAFAVCERWIMQQAGFPISVYFIEALLTVMALSGVRVAAKVRFRRWIPSLPADLKPILMVGAGEAASTLLLELPRKGYFAVGMVDDDGAKLGANVHGIPVLGTIADIPRLVAENDVEELLIAIPSANSKQMRRITDYCQQTRLRFRTIPGLSDLIEGRITLEQLRDVNLEDLLGRDPVRLNFDHVSTRLQCKVVMVTGAAGSIGSELCKQITRFMPTCLVCVDHGETPLFYLQQQLKAMQVPIVCVVADIKDSGRMDQIIKQHGVHTIFHAAAYKHVPLMEENLCAALENNVFGLVSLVEAAERCGCEDFLLVSSDKAVNPTSFMGCTKRVGELFLAQRRNFRMRCISVRFGNVLGSQGSVVPLFQEQIRQNRCVTITHPEMTRYFMTIPEAVSLVLQAFSVGQSGDILVLDMGDPVPILELARTLIRVSGLADSDVQIVFTGLRRGEKLAEELFYAAEKRLPTAVSKVSRTTTAPSTFSELQDQLEKLQIAMRSANSDAILGCMKEIVPEYKWSGLHFPKEPLKVVSAQSIAEVHGNQLELRSPRSLIN